MPNGYDYSKEYGGHDYPNTDGTSNCSHSCGCWAGDARSDGPIGVDPFGSCPKNPVDGELVGGDADQKIVVEQRIRALTSRASRAESALEQVSPDKKELAGRIEELEKEALEKDRIIDHIREMLSE